MRNPTSLLLAATLASCSSGGAVSYPPDLAGADLSGADLTGVVEDLSGGGSPDLAAAADLSSAKRTKVDVLFMIDNSNSMDAMQTELRNRIPLFVSGFNTLAQQGTFLDLQIGVITSDYGAGSTGAPGCQVSPGGQGGRLQAKGAAASNLCKPPNGANYIKYAFKAGGQDVHNLPQGQDLAQTFQCMASVGATGCGFEHQLESVYAALHNNLPENAGFLRVDAILAIVLLTNEDDCSGDTATDVFDRNKVVQYGYLSSYRCTRYGIVQGNGALMPYGDSGGAVANPLPAPNPNGGGPGRLFDVSRYVSYFTTPLSQGGLKADPADLVVVSIQAPPTPVQSILSNPGTPGGQPFVQCGQLNEITNPPCVPVLQHACMNQNMPTFFGDPGLRLSTVISSVKSNSINDICTADFSPAIQSLMNLIAARL